MLLHICAYAKAENQPQAYPTIFGLSIYTALDIVLFNFQAWKKYLVKNLSLQQSN